MLAVEEWSAGLLEGAQGLLEAGLEEIDRWTREHVFFQAATSTYRSLARQQQTLTAFQRGLPLGEMLDLLARVEAQDMSLSRLQAERQPLAVK